MMKKEEVEQQVTNQLSWMSRADRKRSISTIQQMIVGRITKGWAFLGKQTAEDHQRDAEMIRDEVMKQLRPIKE
jgi:hypothetical protein